MRVLLLSAQRSPIPRLAEALTPFCQSGVLTAKQATQAEVRAAVDEPAAVVPFENWDTNAAEQVHELSATASVYVILPTALSTSTYRTILEAKAVDAASAGPDALHALALKLYKRSLDVRGPRWQIGDLMVDAVERRIAWRGRSVSVTQGELRLLWSLVRPSRCGRGLHSEQLAARLGETPGSVRNLVSHLRWTIEEGLGHAAVLLHERKRGYFLAMDLPPTSLTS